jgi:hypothetical protein
MGREPVRPRLRQLPEREFRGTAQISGLAADGSGTRPVDTGRPRAISDSSGRRGELTHPLYVQPVSVIMIKGTFAAKGPPLLADKSRARTVSTFSAGSKGDRIAGSARKLRNYPFTPAFATPSMICR